MEIHHDIREEGCGKCIMIVQYDISRRSGVAINDTQNIPLRPRSLRLFCFDPELTLYNMALPRSMSTIYAKVSTRHEATRITQKEDSSAAILFRSA